MEQIYRSTSRIQKAPTYQVLSHLQIMTMFFQIRSLYKPASLYFTTYSISPAFQNLFNVPFSDFQLFGGALFPLPFPVVVNAAFLARRLLHFFSSNHAVLSRIKTQAIRWHAVECLSHVLVRETWCWINSLCLEHCCLFKRFPAWIRFLTIKKQAMMHFSWVANATKWHDADTEFTSWTLSQENVDRSVSVSDVAICVEILSQAHSFETWASKQLKLCIVLANYRLIGAI